LNYLYFYHPKSPFIKFLQDFKCSRGSPSLENNKKSLTSKYCRYPISLYFQRAKAVLTQRRIDMKYKINTSISLFMLNDSKIGRSTVIGKKFGWQPNGERGVLNIEQQFVFKFENPGYFIFPLL